MERSSSANRYREITNEGKTTSFISVNFVALFFFVRFIQVEPVIYMRRRFSTTASSTLNQLSVKIDPVFK